MKFHYIILITALFLGCSKNKESKESNVLDKSIKENVSVIVVKLTEFSKELVSNGKLEAVNKVDLQFSIGGVVDILNIKNGSKVKAGQIVAKLNTDELNLKLKQAKLNIQKSELKFKDILIGQGYSKDTSKIPGWFLNIARIKSGLADAIIENTITLDNYAHSTLKAPFDGIIANLSIHKWAQVSPQSTCCTLIGNKYYYVRFSLLESEVQEVAVGKLIIVQPLSGGEYSGVIDQINPIVDKNGLVTVYGKVENTNGKLLNGMNVKVWVRTKISNCIVVPKTAVLVRQNKKVIFTLKNDSIAIWNYVTTGLENTGQYVITKGLKSGDTVIIENNVNLAHESIVKVKAQQNHD